MTKIDPTARQILQDRLTHHEGELEELQRQLEAQLAEQEKAVSAHGEALRIFPALRAAFPMGEQLSGRLEALIQEHKTTADRRSGDKVRIEGLIPGTRKSIQDCEQTIAQIKGALGTGAEDGAA